MDHQHRDELFDLVRRDDRYGHIWVKQAVLQNDKFALKFVKMPNRQNACVALDDLAITIKGCDDGEIANAIGFAIKEIIIQCKECFSILVVFAGSSYALISQLNLKHVKFK
jgi:hypothetical protein